MGELLCRGSNCQTSQVPVTGYTGETEPGHERHGAKVRGNMVGRSEWMQFSLNSGRNRKTHANSPSQRA